MQVDFTQVVNELANRLRILEGKQNLGQEKLLIMNQNMIEEYKKLLKDIKAISAESKQIKEELSNVKNILKHLSEEAGQFARQNEVKVLEKYIKLWDPINFVTSDDVQVMIEKALRNKEHGGNNTNKRKPRNVEEGDEQ